MTAYDLELIEKDAHRPDYGGKYYKPPVVLALIEELRKTQMFVLVLLDLKGTGQTQQRELFFDDRPDNFTR